MELAATPLISQYYYAADTPCKLIQLVRISEVCPDELITPRARQITRAVLNSRFLEGGRPKAR